MWFPFVAADLISVGMPTQRTARRPFRSSGQFREQLHQRRLDVERVGLPTCVAGRVQLDVKVAGGALRVAGRPDYGYLLARFDVVADPYRNSAVEPRSRDTSLEGPSLVCSPAQVARTIEVEDFTKSEVVVSAAVEVKPYRSVVVVSSEAIRNAII